jgi:hypothetical protein
MLRGSVQATIGLVVAGSLATINSAAPTDLPKAKHLFGAE